MPRDKRLKPCPLCGGEATYERLEHGPSGDVIYNIACPTDIEHDGCGIVLFGDGTHTLGDMVSHWNNRADAQGQLCNRTWLAAALWSYFCDEPHVDGRSEYYPPIAPELIVSWSQREHDGDCVQQPAACRRCQADEVLHQADWIIKRADDAARGE